MCHHQQHVNLSCKRNVYCRNFFCRLEISFMRIELYRPQITCSYFTLKVGNLLFGGAKVWKWTLEHWHLQSKISLLIKISCFGSMVAFYFWDLPKYWYLQISKTKLSFLFGQWEYFALRDLQKRSIFIVSAIKRFIFVILSQYFRHIIIICPQM